MNIKKNVKRKFRQYKKLTYRIIHTVVFLLNQKLILFHAKKHKKIKLIPIAVGRWMASLGHVEHYYHFIFDLVFPIQRLLLKIDPDVIILVDGIGILNEKLLEMLPDNVKIVDEEYEHENTKKITLIGMNPLHTIITNKMMSRIVLAFKHRLKISLEKEPKKILLIERIAPNNYYLHDAKHKGAGASLRSIINHNELFSYLSKNISDSYTFINLQLEDMSISEQIKFFNEAHMVIAQHGASLSNTVWMRPGSIVMELRFVKRRHFYYTSKIMGLKYMRYKTDSMHAVINIDHFKEWIKQSSLSDFFLESAK